MRKRPQQGRSRATVDAIVEAGAQVLAGNGWEAFNTNRVAQVAGASVGTIYQYFPHKLALLDAIRNRHFEAVVAVVRAAADNAKTLPERIEALVGGMIEVHGSRPSFHRAVLDDAPRASRTIAADDSLEHAYFAGYERLIALGAECDHEARSTMSARVLSSAVEGVIHDAARRGELMSSTFRHELKALVNRYLG